MNSDDPLIDAIIYNKSIRNVKEELNKTTDKYILTEALYKVIDKGNIDLTTRDELITLLINKGADVNDNILYMYNNNNSNDKYTPLIHACLRGNLDTVKLLIEKGAKITPTLIKEAQNNKFNSNIKEYILSQTTNDPTEEKSGEKSDDPIHIGSGKTRKNKNKKRAKTMKKRQRKHRK